MKGARPKILPLLLSLLLIPSFTIFGTSYVVSQPIDSIPQTRLYNPSLNLTKVSKTRTLLANENPPRNWTVLVYMAADNDQHFPAFDNINEMEIVGSTQQVNIIVYVDFLTNSTQFGAGAYTFNITRDSPLANSSINSQPLNTPLPTEPNMGDPTTLLAFIQFAQNYSQAEHYMLIIWDKGTGYTGVCFDETSGGDRLLPQEIALVLENNTIEPISITAFDASLMGQIELAYELQEGTEYIIFSEETIPNQHFPYHTFLNSLILQEDSSPFLLAKEVVDRYIEAYSPGGTYYSDFSIPPSTLCLSVINTSMMPTVFTWFNQAINWLNTSYNIYRSYSGICKSRGLTQQFSVAHYIDLGTFAYQLLQWVPDLTFQNFVENLSISIQSAVSYQLHLSGSPGATGLGINFNYYDPVPLSFLNNSAYEDVITKLFTLGETADTSILSLSLGPIFGYLDGKADSVYFRFSPQIAVEHTVILTAFQNVDEDFDLYLYDSNLNLLTRAVGITSDEAVQWSLIPGQLYYIQIFSNPRADITYGLGSFEIIINPSFPVNPASVVIQIGIFTIILCIILFIIYIIWRNWENIKRAIESYQIRRMAKRIQTEATTETGSPTSTSTCEKCSEVLPEDAKFCSNCGETFEEPSENPKD